MLQQIGAPLFFEEGGENEMKREELSKLLEECKTLEEIQALGKKLGYADGWSVHVFESRMAKERKADE